MAASDCDRIRIGRYLVNRTLCALLLLVTTTGMSEAQSPIGPSFDCELVTEDIAKTICGDTDLRRLDLGLVQSYYALRLAQPDRQESLRQEAIDFHRQTRANCFPSGVGISPAERLASERACVASAYGRQRKIWLDRVQNSGSVNAIEEARRPIEAHWQIQQRLQALGLLSETAAVDGAFGPATRQAIMTLQEQRGLAVDGFVSDRLFGLLFPERDLAAERRAGPFFGQSRPSQGEGWVNACDLLAAPVGAPERLVPGVRFGQINTQAAIGACELARRTYPGEPRFITWLARSLEQEGLRIDEATRLYMEAANQGYFPAQVNLGNMHLTGRGVPRDDGTAAMWFRRAAEQGSEIAEINLRNMQAEGRLAANSRIPSGASGTPPVSQQSTTNAVPADPSLSPRGRDSTQNPTQQYSPYTYQPEAKPVYAGSGFSNQDPPLRLQENKSSFDQFGHDHPILMLIIMAYFLISAFMVLPSIRRPLMNWYRSQIWILSGKGPVDILFKQIGFRISFELFIFSLALAIGWLGGWIALFVGKRAKS